MICSLSSSSYLILFDIVTGHGLNNDFLSFCEGKKGNLVNYKYIKNYENLKDLS